MVTTAEPAAPAARTHRRVGREAKPLPAHVRRELSLPNREIGIGSRGGDVRKVQEWLCHHGHRTVVDGAFGPATAACLRAFQSRRGFTPSGALDAPTWEALVRPLAEAMETPDPAALAALSPAAAVLEVAERHLAQNPTEIGGANRGPWVRLYCDGADGPEWAWCAGFVSQVVRQAFEVREERAPVLGSVSCDTLAAQASSAERFVAGRDAARDENALRRVAEGAIFLRRRTSTDWVHAGFVLGFERGGDEHLTFRTIEGNTNDEGHREGYEACRRVRTLSGEHYDFISLEPRAGD